MDIGIGSSGFSFTPIAPLKPLESQLALPAVDGGGGGNGFVDMLRAQLDQLIELQNQAETLQQDLAAGRVDNIQQVLLAVQKADLALNFALELRNKVVEAYQEISRMQI